MTKRLIPLLALAVAACSVGEDYQRPQAVAPAAWSQSVAMAEGWPSAEWWTAFGSPELNAYMDNASQANFDLLAAVAQIREADALARVAGAPLLPSVSLGAGAERSQTPTARDSSTRGATPTVANTFNAAPTASYEIDFWGKNAAALASAEATATGSRFNRQTLGLTVQAGVADGYFAIIGLQDRLVVARNNLANSLDVLSVIDDRMKGGTATDLDLAQQESLVEIARAAIPPLEQSLAQNTNALALLTGKLPEELAVPPRPLASINIPGVTPGLPSTLLARRPDVLSAEQQLVGANADITAARAAFFPSITLTAEYGVESLALNTLLKSGSILWSAAASASQPIFTNGLLEGELGYRRARYDELVANYRKAVVSAFGDVETALVAVKKTAEEEDAERRVQRASKRAYDIAIDQLRGGIVDITVVLSTQSTLFLAEDNLVQARLAHLQAVVGLYQALGGGWDGKI